MNSVKDLESKIRECVERGEEFFADYERLVFETRELRKTIEGLEAERREMRRKIESMMERVKTRLEARG